MTDDFMTPLKPVPMTPLAQRLRLVGRVHGCQTRLYPDEAIRLARLVEDEDDKLAGTIGTIARHVQNREQHDLAKLDQARWVMGCIFVIALNECLTGPALALASWIRGF